MFVEFIENFTKKQNKPKIIFTKSIFKLVNESENKKKQLKEFHKNYIKNYLLDLLNNVNLFLNDFFRKRH